LPRSRVLICSTQRRKFAGAIHLVDECDARDTVLVHLAPDGLGLRLHAGDRAINGDRRIQHAQGAFHFDRKIDVSRGIDDIDAVLGEALVHSLPETGRGRSGDGDAALLLLFHVIHHCRAVVDLADFVGHAGIEQNTLRRGGLPRVDVSGNTDISVALDGRSACHMFPGASAVFMRFAHFSCASRNVQRGRSDPAR